MDQRVRNTKWIILFTVLAFAGCNQANPIIAPVGVNELQAGVSNEGFFSAVDGKAVDGGSVYSVLGSEVITGGTRSINIVVPKQASVPYTVTVNTDPNAVIGYNLSTTVSAQYVAQNGIGSGTITISQVTPTLRGTFSGTLHLTPKSGSDTIRTITSGEFNASF